MSKELTDAANIAAVVATEHAPEQAPPEQGQGQQEESMARNEKVPTNKVEVEPQTAEAGEGEENGSAPVAAAAAASDVKDEEEALVAEDEEAGEVAEVSDMAAVAKYRQWLYDRCDGTSKYDPTHRPPCFICYVPIPVRWLADYIEMNQLFETVGRIGCVDPEDPRIRRWLFTVALVCNVCSLILTFYAALATTMENFDLLQAASFTRVDLQINNDGRGRPLLDTQVDFGLRAVALQSVNFAPEGGIVSFDEFCSEVLDVLDVASGGTFISQEECDACNTTSFPIIFSLVLSLVFTWPTITTNFLRMYPNYDVNCQKFFGAIVGMISLISSCYSWLGYTNTCFNRKSEGSDVVFGKFTALPDDFVVTAENEADLFFFQRDWDAGPGLVAIVVAFLLKGVDSAVNWIVPTPSITRNHNEQREYEYLSSHAHQRSLSVFERVHQKHCQEEVLEGGRLVPIVAPVVDEEGNQPEVIESAPQLQQKQQNDGSENHDEELPLEQPKDKF